MMKYLITLVLLFTLFSCDDIIEVEDISNRTITVLAPTDAVVLNNTSINFTWESVNDAESYTIQIATPDFENAQQIVLDSTISATSFSMLLEFNTYEWRINARNSAYNTAYTTQSFTIEE